VFENRVLRGIFGPKGDEVTGEWRKLHNEELNDLYCSPTVVRVITSRRMRWVGHVERFGGRACTGFWWGNLRERDHLGEPGVDGRIMLRHFQDVGCGGMDWIELAKVVGTCECGNEPLGSIKWEEFLD
jgi:hypothetical protein